MKKISNTRNQSKDAWKKRPSEIKGYTGTYYINTSAGDYVRVDYSFSDKKARLYVESSAEGGKAYYSIIKGGKVISERSVAGGSSQGLSGKFSKRSDVFSSVPNVKVLKLISENYGIFCPEDNKAVKQKQAPEPAEKSFFPAFLRRKKGSYPPAFSAKPEKPDFFDLAAALLAGGGVFYLSGYSFILSGIVLAFSGIISGAVDVFGRKRNPYFIKILFLTAGGFLLYLYGYYFLM